MNMFIAEKRNYTISINCVTNRLYITLRGFWLDPSKNPDYVEDITLAVKKLEFPFTALVDVREMRTPGHLVKDIHIEAQKVSVAAGLEGKVMLNQ